MLLLLLLLLLYYSAPFGHVSFKNVSAILHYGRCDSANFSVITTQVIQSEVYRIFPDIFFILESANQVKTEKMFLSIYHQNWTRQYPLVFRHASVIAGFLHIVLFPRNRLLVYEGSL